MTVRKIDWRYPAAAGLLLLSAVLVLWDGYSRAKQYQWQCDVVRSSPWSLDEPRMDDAGQAAFPKESGGKNTSRSE